MVVNHNKWLILFIISSALFLIVIDATVLYTALPRLTHDLGLTASEKLWVVNAYPLVVAGLLPGVGMLGDRLGHKRMFTAGLPVFGVASLCVAYATAAPWLIAARALLAVGAAMMMPATLSILRHVFEDDRERALAIGIWSAVASGGAALGPVVGGVLLEFFWWGSVFLINVPVVLLAWPLALRLIPKSGGTSKRPWDLLGSIQVMIGLVGVIYAIKELSKPYPDYVVSLAAGVIGVIGLWLFFKRQQRQSDPMIDFALFRNRRFSSGVVVALMSMTTMSGVELVYSQRLQLVLGLTPLQAAMMILPIPLASAAAGALAGLTLPRFGEYRIMWGCMFLSGVGIALTALMFQDSLVVQIIGLVLFGAGLGGAMTSASTAVMMNAPKESAGMAASIEEVSYELGGVLGVTILGSVMGAVYTTSLEVPPALQVPSTAYDSLDEALTATAQLTPQSADLLTRLAHSAFDQAFFAVSITTAVLLFLTVIAVKRLSKSVIHRKFLS